MRLTSSASQRTHAFELVSEFIKHMNMLVQSLIIEKMIFNSQVDELKGISLVAGVTLLKTAVTSALEKVTKKTSSLFQGIIITFLRKIKK